LGTPHARIVDSIRTENCTTIIMEFIEGINCEAEPTAEHLYIAAEKIGAIYDKSKMNMCHVDKAVAEKYTITKKIIADYIKLINEHYDMPPMDLLIDYIFEKYQDRTLFVNHNDMQFKNFIYNDDINFIDWECANISPFFTDLHSLISRAGEVDADINEIKKRYCQFSQISAIDDEDIDIAGIITSVGMIYDVFEFDCPVEWADDSYNKLLCLIQKFNFQK
jgi:hypothetical protein